MKDTVAVKILEEITLPRGMEIDLDEGWRKLISRQFGGSPGRGFNELIQNLLDSYASETPWAERRGEITTGDKKISIKDWGEGMDRSRLKYLTTLGGTDKNNDTSKIGQFGIGFFSIFNPRLGTQKVVVTTRCEEHTVRLVFTVVHPEKRPEIETSILSSTPDYSTRIEVFFDNAAAPGKCIDYAQKCLRYYPCRITVNGQPHMSVWEDAREMGLPMFEEGSCSGFLSGGAYFGNVDLLCKYEHIMDLPLSFLITGGYNVKHDLRDFAAKQVPYVPNTGITINCNNLSVTISRDSFSLDYAYSNMIGVISRALLKPLAAMIDSGGDTRNLILANQFILRDKISAWLKSRPEPSAEETLEQQVIRMLAKAKIYRLNGRKNDYCLADIYDLRSKDVPLFYAPERTNLNWLGGSFKHDFIVLPSPCTMSNGAPAFHETLFEAVFDDTVNLDTVKTSYHTIEKLVGRGIVDRESLDPSCQFVGERRLKREEQEMLSCIEVILNHQSVKEAIKKHLRIPVQSMTPVFFEVEGKSLTVATGLFNQDGSAFGSKPMANLEYILSEGQEPPPPAQQDVYIGLRVDHPFIQFLVDSHDPHKPFYMLTFLAHELALCQKLLVPYSQAYHFVKDRLAADMRRALMSVMLADIEQPQQHERIPDGTIFGTA